VQRQKCPTGKFLKDFWLEYTRIAARAVRAEERQARSVFADAAMHFLEWGFTTRGRRHCNARRLPLQRTGGSGGNSALAEFLIGIGSALTMNGRARAGEAPGRGCARACSSVRKRSARGTRLICAVSPVCAGECGSAQGRPQDAAPYARRGVRHTIDASRQSPPDCKTTRAGGAGQSYSMLGKPEQAAQLQQKITPPPSPRLMTIW
jgi:hypothetical protein